MKDVLVFVMGEMAKESDTDFKFQMPKHTSFVGSIIKNVGIEVISRNESYRNFLGELSTTSGKYLFDTNNEMFRNIYRDTVLLLAEKGYLFDDDPELLLVNRQLKGVPQLENHISQPNPLQSISISAEDIMQNLPQGTYPTITTKQAETAVANEDEENEVVIAHWDHQ